MNLIWDQYDGLEYDQIVIYRGDSPTTLEEYVALPGNVFSYTDSDALSGDAYYQIVITTSVECNVDHALYQLKSNVAGFLLDNVNEVDWLTEVYPNPFKDAITLNLEEKAQVEIIDHQGKLIRNLSLDAGSNFLPTSDLSMGIYILRVTSNDETAIWRGVKTN